MPTIPTVKTRMIHALMFALLVFVAAAGPQEVPVLPTAVGTYLGVIAHFFAVSLALHSLAIACGVSTFISVGRHDSA